VLHFSTVAVNVNLDKKYFGLHFGPFFHELIRSPWLWIAILLFRFDFSASLRSGGEREGEREKGIEGLKLFQNFFEKLKFRPPFPSERQTMNALSLLRIVGSHNFLRHLSKQKIVGCHVPTCLFIGIILLYGLI
jgi:hypothetical protein